MSVLRLKASLRNGISSVWRIFEINENFTFAKLHEILQILFGYLNRENYEFFSEIERWRFTSDDNLIETAKFLKSDAGKAYIEKFERENYEVDISIEVASAREKQIGLYFQKGKTITYLYDFADEWLIDITCEEIISDEFTVKFIDGFGTAVYEGVGGVKGYQNLMEVLSDANHDSYDEVRFWLYEEGYRRYDEEDVREKLSLWEKTNR